MANELTTVHRQLGASRLRDTGSIRQAAGILAALPGVIEAKPDPSGKRIRISYDVTKLEYSALIKALEAEDLVTKPGRWGRIKEGWYQDQDIIIRDNARAKPSPCCSNPTGIMLQSGKKGRR